MPESKSVNGYLLAKDRKRHLCTGDSRVQSFPASPHAVENVAVLLDAQEDVGHRYLVHLGVLHVVEVRIRLPDLCLHLGRRETREMQRVCVTV